MKNIEPEEILFDLGQVLITPAARKALLKAEQPGTEFLIRHQSGDWGELDEQDKMLNNRALALGDRLLSAYRTSKGERFYIIITEYDRSRTTILLPEEY